MKKLSTVLLFTLILSILTQTVIVYASFGMGASALTGDASLIKSSLYGKKIVFSELDFKQGLAITDFDEITIVRVPKASEGALMLGGKRISDGTKIKRKKRVFGKI